MVVVHKQQALNLAISRYRMPSRPLGGVAKSRLSNLLEPIKIVSGDMQALKSASQVFSLSEVQVKEACEMFLQEWLSQDNLTPHEILGLDADASSQDFKHNKRALLKWLHPDRNPSKWQQKLFYRISELQENEVNSSNLQMLSQPTKIHHSTHLKRTKARSSWQIVHNRKKKIDWRAFRWRVLRGSFYLILLMTAVVFATKNLSNFAEQNLPYFQHVRGNTNAK